MNLAADSEARRGEICGLQWTDIVSVSERLGYSDTAVTLRMYAHANEESIRRAGQTVRDALKGSGNKQE